MVMSGVNDRGIIATVQRVKTGRSPVKFTKSWISTVLRGQMFGERNVVFNDTNSAIADKPRDAFVQFRMAWVTP